MSNQFGPDYVRAIAPYQGGKPIAEVAREFGLDEAKIIKLASNENPLGMPESAKRAMLAAMEDIARYPDANGFDLKAALSQKYDVPPEWITLGNGSNDILELAAHAFVQPGDYAIYSEFSFAVYPLAVQATGGKPIVVPAKNYAHDLPGFLSVLTPAVKLIFIANPNNPTGTFIAKEELEAFIKAVPPNVVVVLDQAYDEYLAPELQYDSTAWVRRHPNLIVSRTFPRLTAWPACASASASPSPALPICSTASASLSTSTPWRRRRQSRPWATRNSCKRARN